MPPCWTPRDHPEAQLTGQTGLQRGDLVDEGVMVGQDAPGPQHEPLAFRGQAVETLPRRTNGTFSSFSNLRMASDSAGCDT